MGLGLKVAPPPFFKSHPVTLTMFMSPQQTGWLWPIFFHQKQSVENPL